MSADASGAAAGTTAAVSTESAAATDGTTEIGTAVAHGAATNGIVQTSGTVEGATGSGWTEGTAAGDTAASDSVRNWPAWVVGGCWACTLPLTLPLSHPAPFSHHPPHLPTFLCRPSPRC